MNSLEVATGGATRGMSGVDLRNAAIQRIIRELEALEKTLKDGDPVRDAALRAGCKNFLFPIDDG
jgi:hypothetical protein